MSVPLLVRDRKQWLRIAAAMLIACALLVPFLIPYFRVACETGMRRSWSDVKSWSARPRDWLNPGATNRMYRRIFDPKPDPELGKVNVVIRRRGDELTIDREPLPMMPDDLRALFEEAPAHG